MFRALEIARILIASAIAELRHWFTRYRRGPRCEVWDVDVVYLWSDPSDPDWSERRAKVLAGERGGEFCNIDQQTATPQYSLDELRYSLRSVDRYLRGKGKVHLVVDGQVPAWVDRGNPNLNLVEVRDIISDSGHYPNFNTQAIESYFFNIPGLSERFIYFNDDFFLNREVGVDGLFTDDGRPKVRLGRGLSPKGEPVQDEDGDSSGHKNANALLDKKFGRRTRLTVMHRPYSHTKSLMRFASEYFGEAFEATRSSRFRSTRMYALHSFLIPYAAAQAGEADLGAPAPARERHVLLGWRPRQERRRLPPHPAAENRGVLRAGGARGRGFRSGGRPVQSADGGALSRAIAVRAAPGCLTDR